MNAAEIRYFPAFGVACDLYMRAAGGRAMDHRILCVLDMAPHESKTAASNVIQIHKN